jgi:hypothetical protein
MTARQSNLAQSFAFRGQTLVEMKVAICHGVLVSMLAAHA